MACSQVPINREEEIYSFLLHSFQARFGVRTILGFLFIVEQYEYIGFSSRKFASRALIDVANSGRNLRNLFRRQSGNARKRGEKFKMEQREGRQRGGLFTTRDGGIGKKVKLDLANLYIE